MLGSLSPLGSLLNSLTSPRTTYNPQVESRPDDLASTRLALEGLHQSADVGPHHDLVAFQLGHFFWHFADRRQVPADHVRASRIVVGDPFGNEMVQVPAAEDDEAEKAFPFQALDEPLAAAVQVRAGDRQRIRPHAPLLQCGDELLRELGVAVVHHDGRLLGPALRLFDESLGLLHNPAGIRPSRRRRNDHFTGLHAQKHQAVQLLDSAGRDRLHRKEVAGPERVFVSVEKVAPFVGGAIRRRFDPFFLQDVSHRLPADLLDPHFSHLANDAGVPEPRGFRDLND